MCFFRFQCLQDRHVFAPRFRRHDEIGRAEKVVRMGSDRSGVEHGGGVIIVRRKQKSRHREWRLCTLERERRLARDVASFKKRTELCRCAELRYRIDLL